MSINKNFLKTLLFFPFLITTLIFSSLFSSTSNLLEEALKKKEFISKDNVIITNPCNKKNGHCHILTPNTNKNYEIDLLLLQKKIKKPIHPLNESIIELKEIQKEVEKEISKDIKRLFFIPKKIKVKSHLKNDKIYTRFIYYLED